MSALMIILGSKVSVLCKIHFLYISVLYFDIAMSKFRISVATECYRLHRMIFLLKANI